MTRLSFSRWQELHPPVELREGAERTVIKHLTHIEDLVVTDYAPGAKQAVQMLSGLAAYFKGHANAPVNLTVKIDGAPALVAGIDPADGKFFIGTKGAFAKTPRIAKSLADIKTLYAGKEGLIDTMSVAFTTLKKLSFPHILQGDVLFTPALKQRQTIDGTDYVTFKPNTIVYGVPVKSDLGEKITAATFGICFHTTYVGNTLETVHATPGADIDRLHPSSEVVLVSSRYQDLSGTLSFTGAESTSLATLIADIKTRTAKLAQNGFVSALKTTPLLQSEFMIFQNALVRGGESITLSPKVFVARFVAHLSDRAAKEAVTKKTDKGKDATQNKYQDLADLANEQESALVDMLAWQQAIIAAKTFIIGKLNTTGTLATFYSSDTGMVAGAHEGFVAADRNGNFVKLVDRAGFSVLNLTQGRFRT